jgi:hypothetical protein
MTNCPICNRETNQDCNWCEDCLTEWKTYHSDYFYEEPPPRLIAEWAARRAREFERNRAYVEVAREALEEYKKE